MGNILAKVRTEIEDRISNYQEYIDSGYSDEEVIKQEELKDLLTFIDSLQEEPVSEELELTWEDIPKIFQISGELKTSWWFRDNEQTKLIGTQVFWEEVLKRFKEKRRQ